MSVISSLSSIGLPLIGWHTMRWPSHLIIVLINVLEHRCSKDFSDYFISDAISFGLTSCFSEASHLTCCDLVTLPPEQSGSGCSCDCGSVDSCRGVNGVVVMVVAEVVSGAGGSGSSNGS